MTPLELTAVAFSLACVVLAGRRQVGTWPAGIVAVIAYFVIFARTKLYADAALQVVFLGQGVYGWLQWVRRNEGRAPARHVPVRVLTSRRRVALATAVAVVSIAIGAGLSRFTDASSPFLDSTVSVLSLTANWLLARRVLENWALWLVADVLYVGLFLSKGLVASAALYVIFLLLAVSGWRSWVASMTLPGQPAARRAI